MILLRQKCLLLHSCVVDIHDFTACKAKPSVIYEFACRRIDMSSPILGKGRFDATGSRRVSEIGDEAPLCTSSSVDQSITMTRMAMTAGTNRCKDLPHRRGEVILLTSISFTYLSFNVLHFSYFIIVHMKRLSAEAKPNLRACTAAAPLMRMRIRATPDTKHTRSLHRERSR